MENWHLRAQVPSICSQCKVSAGKAHVSSAAFAPAMRCCSVAHARYDICLARPVHLADFGFSSKPWWNWHEVACVPEMHNMCKNQIIAT